MRIFEKHNHIFSSKQLAIQYNHTVGWSPYGRLCMLCSVYAVEKNELMLSGKVSARSIPGLGILHR
jgi:hypothetical protein